MSSREEFDTRYDEWLDDRYEYECEMHDAMRDEVIREGRDWGMDDEDINHELRVRGLAQLDEGDIHEQAAERRRAAVGAGLVAGKPERDQSAMRGTGERHSPAYGRTNPRNATGRPHKAGAYVPPGTHT